MKKYLLILALMLPLVVSAQTASSTVDLLVVIKQLQTQIQLLQTQVTDLQAQIQSVKTELNFTRVLARGASGDDVKQLQEFLKTFPDIYPEGLITGYFGPLTEAAIKRFQEKQGIVNSGSQETNGFGQVGPKTTSKINELLSTGAGASGVIPSGLLTAPGSQTQTATITASTTATSTLSTTTTPVCNRDYSTCSSKQACETAKFFWYTLSCHPTPPPSESCASSYNYCATGIECSANGWYSCRSSCYGSVEACLGQTYVPPAVSTAVSTPAPSSVSGSSGAGVTTTTGTTTTTATTTTTTTVDTTPPSIPTGLSVSDISPYQTNLSWNASTDNVGVVGYKIYKNGTLIFIAPSSPLSYSDTGVSAGASYSYTVAAYDVVGNISPQSSPVSATTPTTATTPPAAPSNFSATVSGTNVNFTWTDNANNESGFSILRGTSYSFGINMNAQSATDSNLADGTYTYSIMAFNSYGDSGWSSPVSVTVGGTTATAPVTIPTDPSGVTGYVSNGAVILFWTDTSSNETRFEIHRRPQGGSFAVIGQVNSNVTTYTDTPGVGTFEYAIGACNSVGCAWNSGGPELFVPSTSSTASSISLDQHTSNLAAIYYALESIKSILENLSKLLQ